MRYILLLFILLPTIMFCQTVEMERDNLKEMVKEEKISLIKYRLLIKKWNKLLEDFGGYPDLSYNEKTSRIEFAEIKTFSGKSQEDIYKLVKEWGAINYGNLDAVIHYEDKASGKIIVKGHFIMEVENKIKTFWGNKELNSSTWAVNHTAIFTIKKGKLKIEFTNIEYRFQVGGYFYAERYVPLGTKNLPISNFYPITKFDERNWENQLNLLKKTAEKTKFMMGLIEDYVNDEDGRGRF